MAIEFTGERVVPGEVQPDLWNEHVARYAFTARLARRRRVLEIGCGTGYGSAHLAGQAEFVFAVDISHDAVHYARSHFSTGNLQFLRASAVSLPFPTSSFDLVLAYEVIEHVDGPQLMLEEARRVLRPGGQFLVSTPNKDFYSETRRLSGPNPYHHHEFQYEDFRAALTRHFPYVRIFVQNHANGVVFQPVDTDHGNLLAAAGAELCVERTAADASTAHFFLAVCALRPQTGAPTFVYVPTTANVLREREHHILRLEQELTTKDAWLAEAQAEHQALLARHHELAAELNQRTDWAQQLDNQLNAARHRIVTLQNELDAEQTSAREVVRGYEEVIRTLETTIEQNLLTAQQSQLRLEADLAAQCAELDAKCNELSACVSLLHSAEATVEERTQWARALEAELAALRAHLREAGGSRWIRLGRSLGLGPELRQQ